jgi:hypothetical protein
LSKRCSKIGTFFVQVLNFVRKKLSYFAGGEKHSGGMGISKQAVRQEVDRFVEQINSVRTEVEQLAEEGSSNVVWPSLAPVKGTASEYDFRNEFNRLRREMIDLAIAVNCLKHKEALPSSPATTSRSQVVTGPTAAYEIHATRVVRNREVTIKNVGDSVVVNPRLVVNGQRRWFSAADIVREVVSESMSECERALAIWSFLVHNRYHHHAAHYDIELHDPVRYLNVYGYGLCDDSATNFMVLAELAGLESRVWGLSGHVVPEVFFDGAWHMLDPDGEIYYLEDDGKTIASVSTLEQRPDLIRKYPSPYYTNNEMLVKTYTTGEENRISNWYRKTSETVHRMDYVLRPGESIMRSWDNWGIYFSSRYLNAPDKYGNGRFRYEAVFENELFKKGTSFSGKMEVVGGTDGYALSASGATGMAMLVIPVRSPYPLLAGRIHVTGYAEVAGGLTIEFSEDGRNWLTVADVDGNNPINVDVPMRGFFRNGHDRPMYTYSARFTLRPPIIINGLVMESDFQHAPRALPELRSGINCVEYSDETDGDRSVQIDFRFDEDDPG